MANVPLPRVKVRPAEPADLETLCAMLNDAIADGDALVYDAPLTIAQVRQYVEANMTAHVAELVDDAGNGAGGRVVGGYALRVNQPGRGAHVCNATYVVARSARGLGIGRRLGEHSLEQARQLGFRAMQYNAVVSTNAAALRLWQALGFTTVGTLPGAFRRNDGTFADLVVMYRTL